MLDVFGHSVLSTDAAGPDFPVRKNLSGIGFSDAQLYARHLARATNYSNSWFHKPPFRDVTKAATFGGQQYDFVVCSEVLEHVSAPVEAAIETLFALLVPGGTLVLSVPMRDGATVEHFPALVDYEIKSSDSGYELRGTDEYGRPFRSTDLVFHGGPGATLEMRIFGRDSLREALVAAGFTGIEERRAERPELGIVWEETPESIVTPGGVVSGMHSGVWIARRPPVQ